MSELKNSFSGAVCQHVRLNSERCTQPARRNSDFCRFHDAAMKPLPAAHNLNDQLPVLEDAGCHPNRDHAPTALSDEGPYRPQGHRHPSLRTPTRLHQPRPHPPADQSCNSRSHHRNRRLMRIKSFPRRTSRGMKWQSVLSDNLHYRQQSSRQQHKHPKIMLAGRQHASTNHSPSELETAALHDNWCECSSSGAIRHQCQRQPDLRLVHRTNSLLNTNHVADCGCCFEKAPSIFQSPADDSRSDCLFMAIVEK